MIQKQAPLAQENKIFNKFHWLELNFFFFFSGIKGHLKLPEDFSTFIKKKMYNLCEMGAFHKGMKWR